MSDHVETVLERAYADPRIDPEHVRVVPGSDGQGTVVLVGVVHDHPASVARVHRLAATLAPTVLALELPSLSLPLVQRVAATEGADDESTTVKGEMAAAVAGAPLASVAGIDAPARGFGRTLAATLREDGASVRTAVRAVLSLLDVGTHAVAQFVAARLPVDPPEAVVTNREFDCDDGDRAADQAESEARLLAATRSLLAAVDPPAPVRLFDEARERHMADRLTALREDGDVVAVVGITHMEPVAAAMEADGG